LIPIGGVKPLFLLRKNFHEQKNRHSQHHHYQRSAQAGEVNSILSEHGDIIIGRMGLPYPPACLHILSLIVHGTTDEIGAMTANSVPWRASKSNRRFRKSHNHERTD